jgi:hypothetical protein
VSLTGVHADWAGNRHGNGECGFSPLSVRGVTRCMCKGYPATTVYGDCTVCGAGYYETMEEFTADIPPVDSGRVVVKEMQEVFPVTVYAYRGDNPIAIQGVREESITVEDRKGVLTLVFEFMDGSRIGYFPHVDWYSTECE